MNKNKKHKAEFSEFDDDLQRYIEIKKSPGFSNLPLSVQENINLWIKGLKGDGNALIRLAIKMKLYQGS